MELNIEYRISNIEWRRTKKFHSLFIILCSIFIITLSSCFKEKPLPSPADQGIGQTNTIEMGPEYTDQFFYSLATNSVLSHNSRFVYDLMFDCDANKFNIWLNTSKYMSLVRTDKTSLSDVTINDTIGRDFRFELGEFDADSNSFGNWWDTLSANPVSAGKVYIIHLGRDRKSTRLNSSHPSKSRMPSSA